MVGSLTKLMNSTFIVLQRMNYILLHAFVSLPFNDAREFFCFVRHSILFLIVFVMAESVLQNYYIREFLNDKIKYFFGEMGE